MSRSKTVMLDNEEATVRLGLSLSRLLKGGDIILLTGELGAGKTALVKAIAQGLGIDHREVTSPTFTLIHEYPEGDIPLVHADLYRLGDGADIVETGLEEFMHSGEHVVAIEWAEFLPEMPHGSWLRIELSHVSETGRRALIEAHGPEWEKRLEALQGKT